jgi:uncharacterized sulfatase
MKRPNIIFYFTDQQRWDTLGCYGQALPVTPHLDRLAAEGTRFENTFTCQPVCGPARSCLQTGLYATQTGCFRNGISLPQNIDTLARRMNQGGYDTAYVGKWHLASDDGYANYRTTAIPTERQGGYQYFMGADALEFTSHGYNGYVFDKDGNQHDFVGYRVDCINNYAIDYLHQHAEQEGDQPFFLFVSQLDPHHQNDRNRYEGPDGSKERFRDYVVPGDLAGTAGDWRDNYPDYLGQCHSIDTNIGRLMETLQELGYDQNTIIIYTSDHGSHFRTRNGEYKRSCHDGCLRVPLIAWGPGFCGGGVREELVSLIDLPGTLLDYAGIARPDHYQGHSLAELLKGSTSWPDSVFAQISEASTGRTVRTAEWKYAVTAPQPAHPAYSDLYVESHLYNLQNDPHERHNLVQDPQYAAVREELKQQLLKHMAQAGEQQPQIRPASGERMDRTV